MCHVPVVSVSPMTAAERIVAFAKAITAAEILGMSPVGRSSPETLIPSCHTP